MSESCAVSLGPHALLGGLMLLLLPAVQAHHHPALTQVLFPQRQTQVLPFSDLLHLNEVNLLYPVTGPQSTLFCELLLSVLI